VDNYTTTFEKTLVSEYFATGTAIILTSLQDQDDGGTLIYSNNLNIKRRQPESNEYHHYQ
jgi:hypothetical protein